MTDPNAETRPAERTGRTERADPSGPAVTRTADQARGGVVILRHHLARIVFVAALIGIVVVAVARIA